MVKHDELLQNCTRFINRISLSHHSIRMIILPSIGNDLNDKEVHV